MGKTKYFYLYFLLSVSTIVCSCSSDDVIRENVMQSEGVNSSDILSFDSKEQFRQAVESFDTQVKGQTRASKQFYSAEELYENTSEGDVNGERIGFLIPDERYRSFLNKNLEIIVNDTLYRITKDGTFYTRKEYREELRNAINNIEKFRDVNENLKEYGNVKLKNTFGTWDNKERNPISDDEYFEENEDDVEIPDMPTTRASSKNGPSREEVENFEQIGSVNVHVAEKAIRFSPGYLKHKKLKFKSNSRRQLYVSLYRYDYAFGVSIGIDCKVMKKLWHGMSWGRMKHWDDGIYYGMSSLIIRQQLKDPVFDNLMKNGKEMLKSQWQSVNNYKFTTYAEATKNFQGGIENRWKTEYNGNPTKSPFIIPIIGERVTNLLGEDKPSEKAAKMFDKFLVKKGINYLSNLDTRGSGNQVLFFSEQDKTVYSFFSNDITWNGGGYRIKDTFMKYYRNVILDLSFIFGKKVSLKNIKSIKVSDNDLVGSPKIFFCEGIVYTKDGDGWIGAKIIQNNTGGLIENSGHFGGGR